MATFAYLAAALLLSWFSFLLGLLQRRTAPVTPACRSYVPAVPPAVGEFDRTEPQECLCRFCDAPGVDVGDRCNRCGLRA